jgi:hypothetical protein
MKNGLAYVVTKLLSTGNYLIKDYQVINDNYVTGVPLASLHSKCDVGLYVKSHKALLICCYKEIRKIFLLFSALAVAANMTTQTCYQATHTLTGPSVRLFPTRAN